MRTTSCPITVSTYQILTYRRPNTKGQPHSALIGTETVSLVIYRGEPDEITPMEVEVAGAKMRFNRIVLDINARESSDTKFTNDEMEALFTTWARQIGAGRLRRGVIAMINRRIAGKDD